MAPPGRKRSAAPRPPRRYASPFSFSFFGWLLPEASHSFASEITAFGIELKARLSSLAVQPKIFSLATLLAQGLL
jgi:hypothetical protein